MALFLGVGMMRLENHLGMNVWKMIIFVNLYEFLRTFKPIRIVLKWTNWGSWRKDKWSNWRKKFNFLPTSINFNRVLNAAKPGHSADPVSAVTKKAKRCWALSTLLQFNLVTLQGGFQLLDLIITELKSHMICYTSMPLIGWNYSIQTREQIL